MDVFLAKVGVRWLCVCASSEFRRSEGRKGGGWVEPGTHLDDVEEFGDDGGYASEERRPALSFHLFAVSLHLDECALLLA